MRPTVANYYYRGLWNAALRRAGLTSQNGQDVAAAVQAVSSRSGPDLRSFSMSYNRDLGAAGILALAPALALPKTEAEVALVQCAIEDKAVKRY